MKELKCNGKTCEVCNSISETDPFNDTVTREA